MLGGRNPTVYPLQQCFLQRAPAIDYPLRRGMISPLF